MSTTVTSLETVPPTTGEVPRALAARTVRRAVWRAVRDERTRDAFDNLRGDGMSARDATDHLVGPQRDANGRIYSLSDEHVRALLYHKCDRRRAL